MAIYDRNSGYKVKIVKAKLDGVINILDWYVVAIFDDERLSERLNGQRVGHVTRMEKAMNVLKADNGKSEIVEACEKVA